ncbi:ABC transporter permease [Deinococcus soli (ex Cha et al. 2016)]|uniref:ABC transporter permease n=1 Tax=Deinococcus soli (ex Cha et al. 2016) TaxID=1309411 RepID=UPI0019BBDC67|nr:ABC transporter permease [Deinococcus soli (ex Cha et al. 2016)]GGB51212.1 ABC transporter [Deinococcus soli (ex Cha et al. 2016)]
MPAERVPRRGGLRPGMVWQIAARDLLTTLRDRRTLSATILMPLILIPLFTLGLPLLMGNLIGGQQQARQQLGVVGTLPDGLRRALTTDETLPDGTVTRAGVDLVPVTDPLKAVRDGTVEAAIQPGGPLPARAGDGTGTLKLYAKLSNLRARSGAFGKVQDVVDGYNRQLATARLGTLGLGADTLEPVRIQPVDASSAQEQRSGQLAFLIPMLMMQFILAGALATALDATAGEKERGTLESLLVAPVRRAEVVTGKLLATATTALTSAAFSVIGFLLSGLIMRAYQSANPGNVATFTQAMGGQLTLSAVGVLTLLGVAATTALLISSLLILVGIYARSFKEAQTYVAPINLLVVLPAVTLQFADFLNTSAALYATPLIGGMLAILDTVKGSGEPAHAALAIAGNLAGAALFSLLALRSFGREEVIFRN